MKSISPPWQEKDVSYGAKLGLMVLSAVLLIIGIVTFFITFGISSSMLSGSPLPDSTTTNIIIITITSMLCLGSFGGLFVIWPYTRGPARFTPVYGTIAPNTLGHLFEVRFQRYLWGRSMRGAGTTQFTPDGFTIAGHLEPHILFQVAIVLVVTFLPAILFGFGLGIIPALIIAYYVGRKRVTLTLPYPALHRVTVKGRRVTLRTDQTPREITFAVSSVDGERLYREIQSHFPTMVGAIMR